jgi:hypothetical protein
MLSDSAPDISKLPAQAAALQESISNQTGSIATTRMRITELGDQIHTVYRELFEVSVRIIEQTLHGSVARGSKARAEHLASVAKGMELKLQYVLSAATFHFKLFFQPQTPHYPSLYKSRTVHLNALF